MQPPRIHVLQADGYYFGVDEHFRRVAAPLVMPDDRSALLAWKKRAAGGEVVCEPRLAHVAEPLGIRALPLSPAMLEMRAYCAAERVLWLEIDDKGPSCPGAYGAIVRGAAELEYAANLRLGPYSRPLCLTGPLAGVFDVVVLEGQNELGPILSLRRANDCDPADRVWYAAFDFRRRSYSPMVLEAMKAAFELEGVPRVWTSRAIRGGRRRRGRVTAREMLSMSAALQVVARADSDPNAFAIEEADGARAIAQWHDPALAH